MEVSDSAGNWADAFTLLRVPGKFFLTKKSIPLWLLQDSISEKQRY